MPLNPNQFRLDDGFSTVITIANLPAVRLFEKEVTPPSYSAGGPIDTTTMRNTSYRTMAPRKLKGLGKMQATVAYATEALEQIWAQIGVVQEITVNYPDGSAVRFFGWIEEFVPSAHKEGDQPTAALHIQPGMRNTQGVEVPPDYILPFESSNA